MKYRYFKWGISWDEAKDARSRWLRERRARSSQAPGHGFLQEGHQQRQASSCIKDHWPTSGQSNTRALEQHGSHRVVEDVVYDVDDVEYTNR